MAGTDEWVLGGRDHGYVPRGRIDCHARRYQCNICKSYTFLCGAFVWTQKFVGLAGRIRRRRESPQATNHT